MRVRLEDIKLDILRLLSKFYKEKAGRKSIKEIVVELPYRIDEVLSGSDFEIFSVFRDLEFEGWITSKKHGNEDQLFYHITNLGLVEDGYSGLPKSVHYISDGMSVSQSLIKDLADEYIVSSFDSQKWTGSRLILVDENVIRDIVRKSEELRSYVYDLNFESNQDQQDLCSLCDALVALCKMAEPELSIIDLILKHPKFQCTAALLAAVATLRGALGI